MALGQQLRDAREARGKTPSEVAAATRMKVQIVEDLEQEDFKRIAAPIYGKGFIRLYAEHVGLDPVPLVNEYMELHASAEAKTPSLVGASSGRTSPSSKPAPAQNGRQRGDAPEQDLFATGELEEEEPAWRPALEVPAAGPQEPLRSRPSLAERAVSTLEGVAAAVRGGARSAGQASSDDSATRLPWKTITICVGAALVAIFLVSGIVRVAQRLSERTPPGDEMAEALRLAETPPEPYLD